MSYTDYLAEKQTFAVLFKKGVRPVALFKKDPNTDFCELNNPLVPLSCSLANIDN